MAYNNYILNQTHAAVASYNSTIFKPQLTLRTPNFAKTQLFNSTFISAFTVVSLTAIKHMSRFACAIHVYDARLRVDGRCKVYPR